MLKKRNTQKRGGDPFSDFFRTSWNQAVMTPINTMIYAANQGRGRKKGGVRFSDLQDKTRPTLGLPSDRIDQRPTCRAVNPQCMGQERYDEVVNSQRKRPQWPPEPAPPTTFPIHPPNYFREINVVPQPPRGVPVKFDGGRCSKGCKCGGAVSCRAMTPSCLAQREGHRGSGPMPDERTFFDLVRQSYKNPAIDSFSGFKKIYDIPEVKAYINDDQKTILIAYRGTQAERGDLAADAMIAVNNLSSSERYRIDHDATQKLLEQYPSPPYDYYLTGHSLGGAIVTQIKRDFPQLKGAVVFNSANQPNDLINQQPDVKKMYIDMDALYNMGGQVITNKEVLPYRPKTWSNFFKEMAINATSAVVPLGSIANTARKANQVVDAHMLNNFEQKYGAGRRKRGGDFNWRMLDPIYAIQSAIDADARRREAEYQADVKRRMANRPPDYGDGKPNRKKGSAIYNRFGERDIHQEMMEYYTGRQSGSGGKLNIQDLFRGQFEQNQPRNCISTHRWNPKTQGCEYSGLREKRDLNLGLGRKKRGGFVHTKGMNPSEVQRY
jgi:pimeloyl-ACP methyl ester carboxylesterase